MKLRPHAPPQHRKHPTIPVTVPAEVVARIERLSAEADGLLSRAAIMRGCLLLGLAAVERDPGVLFTTRSAEGSAKR